MVSCRRALSIIDEHALCHVATDVATDNTDRDRDRDRDRDIDRERQRQRQRETETKTETETERGEQQSNIQSLALRSPCIFINGHHVYKKQTF
jgi:Ni/Co efflux regulator RcnB